jgi:cysteine synthase
VAYLEVALTNASAGAGNTAAALAHCARAIDLYEALLKADPASAENRTYLTRTYALMAELSRRSGEQQPHEQ